MCGKLEIGCSIKEGFQSIVTGQFDALATKIGELASAGLQAVATFWMKIDSPTLDPQHSDTGTAASGSIEFLHGHALAVSGAIFTFAILAAGLRMAWEQRGEPLRELLKATMLFVLVATAGTAFLQLLVALSDEFAMEVVQSATPKDQQFHLALGAMVVKGGTQAATNQLPLLAAMFLGVAVFFAAVIQVVLMLIRSAMLVLLAGTFPIAAAATNTEVGKAWFKKYCGWALAFIAYKPAAAFVYAAAMKMNQAGMTNQSGNGLVQALTGLMMMLLAVFALPALLRFAVPLTAAVSGGSSGMGSGVADPGGAASGAVSIGRSAFGGRSSSSGGGGGGGGGGGKSASGAIGVAASGGLAAAGAAVTGAKKAGGALAAAASHSAGESGGGSSGSTSSTSGGRGWGGSRKNSSSTTRTPEPTGPKGSR
ncbi:type IV secretion system protein [Kribbella sp. VKM Ac-2568]|uniref:type IV secretion system protein n=1 Tax=Kribbella sp. VKM Ac-2568 TaxID=2512219 RepID=UPI001048B8D9|nr:type IV secretion system protein [Kribbella sp. VKM Ac-2568]TCM45597.1 TrbL/VirB6 plasmid conjugal transfer protein [Kribbella sp. VKM Ac-2568]